YLRTDIAATDLGSSIHFFRSNLAGSNTLFSFLASFPNFRGVGGDFAFRPEFSAAPDAPSVPLPSAFWPGMALLAAIAFPYRRRALPGRSRVPRRPHMGTPTRRGTGL